MRRSLLICSLLIVAFSVSASAQTEDRDQGIELYRNGNFAEAAALLEKFVEVNKRDHIAWAYLGGSLANAGKTEQALSAFRKALSRSKPKEKFDKELKITKRAMPAFTREAAARLVTGKVDLFVEFKADGTIGFVISMNSLPDGLTENAIKAARSIRFEPAINDAKPVSVIKVVTYTFDFL